MAIVERGKGKNKHTIEITQSGAVLRQQEVETGDERLPGYRRFSTPEAAHAALAAEVRAHLKDGMKPADEEARAIAAQVEPGRPPKTTLPLRCDLGIYNEATGFVVTSRRMAGQELDEGSAEWRKAVNRGDLLPLTLVQDDPFVIRVVVGGPLTAQEEAEWVARADWHLNVSDGQLCVTGGAPFSSGDYEDSESYHERFVGEVAIPKGHYKASLYTHLHGVNGSGVIDHLAGGYGRGESVEDWFDRTRPGAEPPNWEDRQTVEFLLHLEPVGGAPKQGLSKLPEDGWFSGLENARKPELCPLGLEPKDVQRRAESESSGWTFIRDTFSMLQPNWGNATPENLAGGGTFAVPVANLARVSRLAWFASRHAVQELRLKPPAGVAVNLGGNWPEGVVAVEEDGVVRMLFSADIEPVKVIEAVGDLTSRIRELPAGTVLELCAAPVEFNPGVPEKAGWLWLSGALSGKGNDAKWTITRALPVVSRKQLEGAIALAGEVEKGKRIAVSGQAECDAIMAWAKRNFGPHLSDNPPQAGKDAITFKKAGYEVQLLGIAAFAIRFADAWPAWVGEPLDDDDDDDDDDDGMFPTEPIKGALLYTTPAGRGFHQTMALLISQGVDAAVRAQEKELKKAGFKEMGDVMCAEFEMIGFHGYCRSDKTAIAWFRVSFPDEATCEILTLFDGDKLLLTSANSNFKHSEKYGLHVQDMMGSTPGELWAAHEKALAEVKGKLGVPREMPANVKGFAEALAVLLQHD